MENHPKLVWLSETEAQLKTEDFDTHEEFMEVKDALGTTLTIVAAEDRGEHETVTFEKI